MSTFEVQIAAFVAKAGKNADLVVRKVALDLFTRVILKTPVDTGRLRGSFTVSIGAIVPGAIALDKSGTATINRVTAATLNLKAGELISLTTSLDYARAIEYGHSKQAPSGMVRVTIQEFNAAVAKAVSGLPK